MVVAVAREWARGQHSPGEVSSFRFHIPDTVDAADTHGNDQSERHTRHAHSHRVQIAVLVRREAVRRGNAGSHRVVGGRSLRQNHPSVRPVPTAAARRLQERVPRKRVEQEARQWQEQIRSYVWVWDGGDVPIPGGDSTSIG